MNYMVIGVIVAVILGGIALWYFFFRTPSGGDKILHLPLRELGLKDISAVPITIAHILPTLVGLGLRQKQTEQAKNGLSNLVTLGGKTEPAFNFLFGKGTNEKNQDSAAEASEAARKELKEYLNKTTTEQFIHDNSLKFWFEKKSHLTQQKKVDLLTQFPLDNPEQFSMAYTNYFNVYGNAAAHFPQWAKNVVDADAATNSFWDDIANSVLTFNLILPQKISSGSHLETLKESHAPANHTMIDSYADSGALFVIDLSFFEVIPKNEPVNGFPRFTPATVIYLKQDPATMKLTPFTIQVSGYQGAGKTNYIHGVASESAWVYALMAARCSVTVYGIWIGHVYHWHIQTASLQMTMYNNFSKTAPVYTLMEPQSDYLIGFDMVLLLLWKHFAPPTSVVTGMQFLELMNKFAGGRTFFMDNPKETLANLNITEADFTTDLQKPWNAYPIVGNLLYIWNATENYIDVFVEEHYKSDNEVKNDTELQKWFRVSGEPEGGNIHFGTFVLDGKESLKKLLTSIIYRITAHGTARMNSLSGLFFVGTFPPCLQSDSIPKVDVNLTVAEKMKYMPVTGTIGEMLTFLYIFIYSAPYEPFIPIAGVGENLFFDQNKFPRSNQALINYRLAIREFIPGIASESPIINQWPLNIET